MALSDGSNLGPFRILAPLGRGGMATVYKAYEPGLDRSVAVKVLPAEFLHDPTFAERFRREAQVVARLEHPNIIPIYNYGIDGVPWMSMRLIGGGALSSIIKASGRLPTPRFLHIVRSVAEALDYAHAQGVVHRDVKPQNILIDERDHVYLADFGLAKMMEGAPGLTQTGMIAGTPEYMAPEQALGAAVDHRADIYALGVVAYACLTGRVPFTADTPLAVLMKHVRDPIPLPPPEEVSDPLIRILLKALAKTPAERWPTAGAFADALRQLGEAPTAQMPPPPLAPTLVTPRAVQGGAVSRPGGPRPPVAPPPPPARKAPVSTRWVIAAVAGLVIVTGVAAAALFWAMRPASPPGAPQGEARTAESVPTPSTPVPLPAEARPSAAATGPETDVPPPLPVPIVSATATAVPSSLTPRPTREPTRPANEAPTSTTRPTHAPGTRPDARVAAPALPPAAPPAPSPTPTPDPTPRPRAGVPFVLDSKIPLGSPTQGPVRLDTVRFKLDKSRTELHIEVAGYCSKGHDQTVDVQLELLDADGQTIALVTAKGGIEEKDTGTIKGKQRLTPDQVAKISQFRLSFQAKKD